MPRAHTPTKAEPRKKDVSKTPQKTAAQKAQSEDKQAPDSQHELPEDTAAWEGMTRKPEQTTKTKTV